MMLNYGEFFKDKLVYQGRRVQEPHLYKNMQKN